jgi:hypothetical protein
MDRSSQIAGRSDWDFDAWMAKGDGCVVVEESMEAFQGLVGNPASCCYDWSLGGGPQHFVTTRFCRGATA